MAERRMFAKSIIDSDAFLDMPLSAQALYFHLAMRADDEGFVNNPKRIQKTIGGNDDDYKVLLAKQFILAFESGVIVIKHWRIHNYIRGDRKKDTVYKEEIAMLDVKDNGAYTLNVKPKELLDSSVEVPQESAVDKRKKAYEESELPYSFDYKIRQAFYGKICPICGFQMRGFVDECGVESNIHRPTIQHNIPISKGGKHELGNISVICHQCNVSLRDSETDELNAKEVIEVWDCLSNVRQMSGICPSNVSIGKDSIDKIRLDKDSLGKVSIVKDNIESEEDKSSSLFQTEHGKQEIYDEIVAHWNTLPEVIPKITKISKSGERKKLLDARLKEYGIEAIHKAIEEIPKSGFLLGHGNRGWTIKFDWFIKPNNFVKVLEGNYRGNVTQSSGSAYVDAINNRMDSVKDFLNGGFE